MPSGQGMEYAAEKTIMKNIFLSVVCFLTGLGLYAQIPSDRMSEGLEPAPPTQEWCGWAFRQIPDHRDISDVDSRAFSADFNTLLKIAYTIADWEQVKEPGSLGGWEFLFYWYAGNGDSPLEDPDHTIQYKVGKVQDGKTAVHVIIHTPGWLPYGPEYHRFTMYLAYEDEAWRIDDWFNWADAERGFTGSMRKQLKEYISWFEEAVPDIRR